MILKQSPKGVLTFESTIDCNSTGFYQARVQLVAYDAKKFYQVSNSNTKSNYIIIDDVKDIVIYNISQKKIARTVPHKDGQVRTNIYPAKEGYVMVSSITKKKNIQGCQLSRYNKSGDKSNKRKSPMEIGGFFLALNIPTLDLYKN